MDTLNQWFISRQLAWQHLSNMYEKKEKSVWSHEPNLHTVTELSYHSKGVVVGCQLRLCSLPVEESSHLTVAWLSSCSKK